MKLFTVVSDDDRLWPHYLKHYTSLGVDEFLVAVNPNHRASLADQSASYNVTFFTQFTTSNALLSIHDAQTVMRQMTLKPGEWHATADLDEFQELPCPLPVMAAKAESIGANAVTGRLIDRIAFDGSLPAIDADTDLWSTFPRQCNITRDIVGGCDVKAMMIRGLLPPIGAYHYLYGQRPFPQEFPIHHFKWQSNILQRLQARLQLQCQANSAYQRETRNFLKHWDTYGKIDVPICSHADQTNRANSQSTA